MKFRAVNCLFLLVLAAILLTLSGCATDDPDNASVRPWNAPTSWQQGGALGEMDTQHR